MTDLPVKDDSARPDNQDTGQVQDQETSKENTSTEDLDADQVALLEAQKELEAEQAGDGEANGDGEGGEKPARPGTNVNPGSGQNSSEGSKDDTPKQQNQGGGQQKGQFIPKARFDEVYERARQSDEKVALLEGQLEAARASAGGNKAAEGTPQQQVEQVDELQGRLQAARVRMSEAAERYDNSEISLKELEVIRAETDDAISEVRQEMLLSKLDSRAPAQQTSWTDDTILDRATNALEERHPSLAYLTEKDTVALVDMARANAVRAGQPIGTGPGETLRLRGMVAKLADAFVPAWYPESREALTAARQSSKKPNPGGGTQQSGQKPMSQQAKDRLKKLEDQSNHPPDTRNMGRSDQGTTEVSEADIMAMSEDEIAALPAATRARFIG